MWDVLPSEIFWGILSHVPIEPLLRFRCVCTGWRQIIDDPTFIRSHLQCQAGRERVMIRTALGRKLYTFSLEALSNDFESETIIWAKPLKTLTRHGVSCIPDLPVATCNGLILIYSEEKAWSLLNPFTRKSIELPPCDDDITHSRSLLCGGLGYDRTTDDYKVVRIMQFYDRNNGYFVLETSIYSLKLGYWRRIEEFPNCSIHWQSRHGIFVNGALHWMSYVKRRGQEKGWMAMMIALDLGTENYRLLPLPLTSLPFFTDLSVVDGCLFLSCIYSEFRCDGWMMKDYSSCGGIINSSWTKLFSFTPQSETVKGEVRFIAYLKNKGQVLIQHSDNELFWLDIEKKSAKRVKIRGDFKYFTSQAFPATLVRLNDNGRGVMGIIVNQHK
ncbi:hypothetical protein ACJIZ3_020634 [Penstemon smallii]|uniref:F-box domain-containing protein n=1 Tax=Penstemon smallii TaxID=265156 RepID=A0ABD3SJS0_9LAMI